MYQLPHPSPPWCRLTVPLEANEIIYSDFNNHIKSLCSPRFKIMVHVKMSSAPNVSPPRRRKDIRKGSLDVSEQQAVKNLYRVLSCQST